MKNNQASLKKNIEDYVQDESLHKEMDVISKAEKNRERKEKRTAYITNDIKWLENCKDWEGLTCIGAIHTEIESKKGKTSE